MRASTIIATVAALAPVSLAANLAITNHCPFVVTLGTDGTVAQGKDIAMGGTININMAPGATSQNAKLRKKGTPNTAGPIQIEWSDTTNLFYDLSLIDGGGFGSTMQPSAAAAGTCLKLTCLGAGQKCKDAYEHPNDTQTHTCPKGTGLTVQLCPGGKVSARSVSELTSRWVGSVFSRATQA